MAGFVLSCSPISRCACQVDLDGEVAAAFEEAMNAAADDEGRPLHVSAYRRIAAVAVPVAALCPTQKARSTRCSEAAARIKEVFDRDRKRIEIAESAIRCNATELAKRAIGAVLESLKTGAADGPGTYLYEEVLRVAAKLGDRPTISQVFDAVLKEAMRTGRCYSLSRAAADNGLIAEAVCGEGDPPAEERGDAWSTIVLDATRSRQFADAIIAVENLDSQHRAFYYLDIASKAAKTRPDAVDATSALEKAQAGPATGSHSDRAANQSPHMAKYYFGQKDRAGLEAAIEVARTEARQVGDEATRTRVCSDIVLTSARCELVDTAIDAEREIGASFDADASRRLRAIAESLARKHRFREARIYADRCPQPGAPEAYREILAEFTKFHQPRRGGWRF